MRAARPGTTRVFIVVGNDSRSGTLARLMTSPHDKRRTLRQLFAGPTIFPAVACGDVVTARLVEQVGLPAIHGSGSTAHRLRGMADAGILDMTEFVNHLRYLCDGVNIPVIADADTGFGNVVNVQRTMREYDRIGVAAIHIEDQLTPKRPMHSGFEGAFISRQEMVDKMRAAADARIDDQLVIIARCDVTDPQERADRVAECLENGADVGWLQGKDAEAMQTLKAAMKGKPSVGVLPAGMTLSQYHEAGANCGLVVGSLQVAGLAAQLQLLEALKATGTARSYLKDAPGAEEMGKFYNGQGTAEVRDVETRFGGA
jgi:2-methylisocitrate lyase-like PEP mutase family enzyme